MTPRTLEDVKRHAASLWVGEFADQTPLDVFGTAAPSMTAVWLRDQGFLIGSESDLQILARACRDAARSMARLRVRDFEPGQEG